MHFKRPVNILSFFMPGNELGKSNVKQRVSDIGDGKVCNFGREQRAVKRAKHDSSACSVDYIGKDNPLRWLQPIVVDNFRSSSPCTLELVIHWAGVAKHFEMTQPVSWNLYPPPRRRAELNSSTLFRTEHRLRDCSP